MPKNIIGVSWVKYYFWGNEQNFLAHNLHTRVDVAHRAKKVSYEMMLLAGVYLCET